MGARGPAPLPTALKVAMGKSWSNQINDQEPQPDLALPDKPEYLDAYASKYWDKISEELYRLGLLTRLDGQQLEMLCVAYSKMVKINKLAAVSSPLTKNDRGQYLANPIYRMARDAAIEVQRCLAKFGMNPSDRSRIRVPAKPPMPTDNTDGKITDFYSHLDDPNSISSGKPGATESPAPATESPSQG